MLDCKLMTTGRKRKKGKVLKATLIALACVTGVPIILVVCVLATLSVPSIQQKAAQKAAEILSERTGIEASVGHFSIRSPFDVLLKDVFVGDDKGDTLAYVGCLDARLRLDALPDSIAVRTLKIENLVAHTGELIPSVGIDGNIGYLTAGLRPSSLQEGRFRLKDILIRDSDISIELNPVVDETAEDAPSKPQGANLALDLEEVTLENVRFRLEPTSLSLDMGRVEASAMVDVGKSCYSVRNIDIAETGFVIGGLTIPIGRFSADAVVDIGNSSITSKTLSASLPEFQADLTLRDTRFDLADMRVVANAEGSLAGARFKLDADYDTDEEKFMADLSLERTDLARILNVSGSEFVVAGHIQASGTGINPSDRKMRADLTAELDSCRFNGLDISGASLSAGLKSGNLSGAFSAPVHFADSSITAALTLQSRFAVDNVTGKYPEMKLTARMEDIEACIPSDTLSVSDLKLDLKTRQGLSDAVLAAPGVTLSANLPAYTLEIPSLLPSLSGRTWTLAGIDSLLAGIPEINTDLKIGQDNPFRGMLVKRGFDLDDFVLSLHSAGASRTLLVTVDTPDLDGKYRLPAMNAALTADVAGSNMDATLSLNSDVRDGLMSVEGIDVGIGLNARLSRRSDEVKVDGELKLADLEYDGKNIGDRKVMFNLRPSPGDPDHFVASAILDDIPLELAKQFGTIPEEIGLQGVVRSRAVVSGLPDKADVFVGVKPVGAALEYKPYDVHLRLGEQEITMEGDRISLNGILLMGADSTSVCLDGGLLLETMTLDVSVKSDAFEPLKLPEGGPMPVYGKLMVGLDGGITGPVDSLLASVDVSVLPGTDITYPIDEKNLAQVSPEGTLKVGFSPGTGLALGGRLNIPKGRILFSPKLYPMMPFSVDKDSYIRFNGAMDDTFLSVSASQKARATYKPVGEVSRMVDFITGVKVGGTLKKLNIGFYLDAPKDKEIQEELSEMPEEDREGLAAVLLATGMYASESNEAAQMEGYALSSIVQSKLNAATSNRLGGKVNLDFGVAKGKHGRGIETTDYTLNVSKSFFNDRLGVKLGASVSDNAEVNKNSASLLNNLSAEYKIDSAGAFKARLFSMKDYNNIVEGELVKSGVGLLYDKKFERMRDSLDRSLGLEVEGNLEARSNNQLGPDMAVMLTRNNIFKKNDVFTAKLRGAYYWNLNRKQSKDPSRNDTYLFGADLSLSFPYMQLGRWTSKYIGRTAYRFGYLNQNISGDYRMHKLYGGSDYSFRKGKHVTHSFSPLGLSIVFSDGSSEDLSKNIGFTDLLKLFVDNEFIPSARYSFSYNDYRDKSRRVNTALEIQLKESANLISGILTACGRDFNELHKTLLGLNYDQFVKCQLELRNRFALNDKLTIATRALAGAIVSFGNSFSSPISETFSIGGPNSIRAFSPRSIGPGDFHNKNYSSQIFHTGDVKLEVNAELRFPIVWKLGGAVFVDAGNVWNLRNPQDYMSAEEISALMKGFNLDKMYNSHLDANTFLNQIALGTGAGLRLDYESIVIRLDLGVAIHAPFDTGMDGYYNIPSFWRDGLRLNFGIGYPF